MAAGLRQRLVDESEPAAAAEGSAVVLGFMRLHIVARPVALVPDPVRKFCQTVEVALQSFFQTLGERFIIKAQFIGQGLEKVKITDRLTLRFDHRIGNPQIKVPIGRIEITVLQESGRRQYQVSVACCGGHHLFMHHREQVFPGQTFSDHRRVRGDAAWVGVVNQQRFDRRVQAGQGFTEMDHVDDPRGLPAQLVSFQNRAVTAEGPGKEQHSLARLPVEIAAGRRQ